MFMGSKIKLAYFVKFLRKGIIIISFFLAIAFLFDLIFPTYPPDRKPNGEDFAKMLIERSENGRKEVHLGDAKDLYQKVCFLYNYIDIDLYHATAFRQDKIDSVFPNIPIVYTGVNPFLKQTNRDFDSLVKVLVVFYYARDGSSRARYFRQC